jgi:hypothetical protein
MRELQKDRPKKNLSLELGCRDCLDRYGQDLNLEKDRTELYTIYPPEGHIVYISRYIVDYKD